MTRSLSKRIARRPRRGFGMIVVILLLMLASIAVFALTAEFSAEARRTRDAATGAQLRQLLAASIPLAQSHLAQNPAQPDLTLAPPIPGSSLHLHFQQPPANTSPAAQTTPSLIQVQVRATLPTATATQTLLFTPPTPTTPTPALHSATLGTMR